MTRHFIKDSKGNCLFYSDSDGGRSPGTSQTVYCEHKGGGIGSSKVNITYNPSKGNFNK